MDGSKDSKEIEIINKYTDYLKRRKEEKEKKEIEFIKVKTELIKISDNLDKYLFVKNKNKIFDKKIKKNDTICAIILVFTLIIQVLSIKNNMMINSMKLLINIFTFPILPFLEVHYFSTKNKILENRKSNSKIGIYDNSELDIKIKSLDKEKRENDKKLLYLKEDIRLIDNRIEYISDLLNKIKELYKEHMNLNITSYENQIEEGKNEEITSSEIIKTKKLN